ncbi:hypothetical protein Cflav_PD1349 [Pedosphaera parvula Ellin514]|uniref:Uncharacterized protein n=1 Tax=Pedosphaera parvula (strain Ellin514) TaxID=320771 RepID=B9XQ13_PEDPL|nr:hypothetical protein Cflav_PD1349 [Pedosphaera parvula Ellin514]
MRKGDRHLAASAYERAIALGSPQAAILTRHANELHEFIRESRKQDYPYYAIIGLGLLVIAYYIYAKIRGRQKKNREVDAFGF